MGSRESMFDTDPDESGVAPDEEQASPEADESPEGDTSPGDDESGVGPEDEELDGKAAKRLRKTFFQEKQKQDREISDLKSLVQQLTGAVQQLSVARPTEATSTEEDDRLPTAAELQAKWEPEIRKDWAKGMVGLQTEVAQVEAERTRRQLRAEQTEQTWVREVTGRLVNKYPELGDAGDPFYQATMQRAHELARPYGKVQEKSALEASILSTAAAEIAAEKPELRKSSRLDEARERGAASARGSAPASTPRRSKPDDGLPPLPKNHAEIMRALKLEDTEENRKILREGRKRDLENLTTQRES